MLKNNSLYFYLILTSLFYISSCNKKIDFEDQNMSFDPQSIIKYCDVRDFLSFVGIHEIKTAELTKGYSHFWEFGSKNKGFDVETLIVLDYNASKIDFYDIITGDIYKTININFFGKDPIYFTPVPFSRFQVLSKNEYILWDFQTSDLYIINDDGKIINKIIKSTSASSLINLSSSSSLLSLGDKFIALGRPFMDKVLFDGYKGKGEYLSIIDLKHNSYKFIETQLPNFYRKNIYGISAHHYQMFDGLYGEIVTTFPIDSYLYKLNLTTYKWDKFGDKINVLKETTPLKIDEKNNNRFDSNKYYWTNDLFIKTHVDPVNKFYIRKGKKAIKESLYNPESVLKTNYTLSFQDADGTSLCNCEMNSSGGYFVFSDGYLYISQSYDNLNSDDKIIFHKYKYLK